MDFSLLSFERDGAALLPRLLGEAELSALRALPIEGPGKRLHDPRLPDLLRPVTQLARSLIGPDAQPVRAVLFDKTEQANWAVAWHQDRTIAVRERIEVEGFGPWSTKDGVLHVAPPVEVLEAMATLRIHLDPCGPDNAPLRAALGSHRLGMTPAKDAAATAAEHPIIECLAEAGDVWVYVTTILHASDKARTPSRRRVLQVDYAAKELPGGLRWRGVA
jgi:ectoine hydroxylase-related dioxygenase (phytanoyl-CoA dioxygenase family)